MRGIDFSSWQGLLSTLLGLAMITRTGVGGIGPGMGMGPGWVTAQAAMVRMTRSAALEVAYSRPGIKRLVRAA